MSECSPSWQLGLPGVPVGVQWRTVKERSVLASQLYASASAHFERYTASVRAGLPDVEAGKRWMEERARADRVMNGQV